MFADNIKNSNFIYLWRIIGQEIDIIAAIISYFSDVSFQHDFNQLDFSTLYRNQQENGGREIKWHINSLTIYRNGESNI